MNLEKIVFTLGQFTNLRKRDAEIDDLLNFAQRQYFALVKDNESITRRFLVYKGIDNNTPPLQVSVNGTANIPSNYVASAMTSMTVMVKGVQRQVEILDSFTFDNRKSHAIEVPDLLYPIANFQPTYIKFLPRNVQSVNMTYLGNPPDVHYATKNTAGFDQYDSSKSAELLWDEPDQVEIIRIALQELGVIVSQQEIKDKTGQPENQKQ